MKINIKVKDIMIFLVWLLMFPIPYISQRANNLLALTIEVVIFSWLMSKSNIRYLLKECSLIGVFLLYIVFSTLYSVGFSTRVLTAFVQWMKYVIFFLFSSKMIKDLQYKIYLNLVLKFTLTIVVISDIVLIITGGRGVGGNEVLGNFIVGNKFTLTYTHMLMLGLLYFVIQKKRNFRRVIFSIATVFCILIAIIADCTTGIIGILVVWFIVIINFTKSSLAPIIESHWVFIFTMIISTSLIVGSDILLENPAIKELFMKYSHTSKILSGRIDMYNICLQYIPKRKWVGYGINCTIVEELLTWGNPQNGLLKMLLDHGIIGTLLFFGIIIKSFNPKYKKNKIKHELILPFYAVLYALAICSVVELSINAIFYFSLSLIFALNNYEVNQYDKSVKEKT